MFDDAMLMCYIVYVCVCVYIAFFKIRFGKKSRETMYDATFIAYEDDSPDDKPLITLIKTKDPC